MLEDFNILAELESAVISIIVGMPLESGNGLVTRVIIKKFLKKKIRKRQEYLKNKYEYIFELLNRMNKSSFYEWLKEKRTINRIISFSNAKDINNISGEQMQLSKESFLADAFKIAEAHDLHEKEELRKILNELLQYVDELFWKTISEQDAFIYKKIILEIRQSVRESTEEIIREIQYHDSFAEYIDNQKVLQEVPFKLDYRSKAIPFVGRIKELKEIDAFCASGKQISWWAVIGKGGSGKSRLVYHYIKENINLPNWKMCFLPEEFFKQVNGGGKYKNWNIWTYSKNLLLVVDYVQKYAKETAQWIEGLAINNSITRKIRILLLERTDGEKSLWMKEGFGKQVVLSLKYNKDFLRLQSLKGELIEFAREYTKKNGKEISEEEAIDAWEKLKLIDPDERILYFIMILEALLEKKPWRSWKRINLADYIVKRENEDIAIRFKNNKDMIRNYNRLLAFATATKELPIFELPQDLPEMIKNEIKEISNNACDKHELSAVMQLKDGILQPMTPDIIGEYMVLYIIDHYFLDKKKQLEFIKNLWIYGSDNLIYFVFRLFEDNMNRSSYDDIIELILFDAVPYDNIYVVENYSKLIEDLIVISNLSQALIFIEVLEKIYYSSLHNKSITCSYAKGLVNLCIRQELPEKKETIRKLEHLAVEYADNIDIQIIYACGLLSLSSDQELLEKKETIQKLEYFAKKYTDNPWIQNVYARGLLSLSREQKLPERKETVQKLENLTIEYADNIDIQITYTYGLLSLSYDQELLEKKETVLKLENFAKEHVENIDIQTGYLNGLVTLSSNQNIPEIKETIQKLENLSKKHVDNINIQTGFAMGLVNLSYRQELPEIKGTLRKLEQLAHKYVDNIDIQTEFAMGLVNLSHRQELPEIKETIRKLEQLARKYDNNIDIQVAYANGLGILSNKQELPEIYVTIEKLEYLTEVYAGNIDVQIVYAKALVTLSSKQELLEKEETIRKLEHLTIKYTDNAEIWTAYAEGLVNLSFTPGLVSINETIKKLYSIAVKHADNIDVQIAYASGLLNLSGRQKQPEIKETVKKLKHFAIEHADNPNIQAQYARALVNLSNRQGLPEIKETIGKLWHMTISHAENTIIQVAYANGLLSLSGKQELPEAEETIEKLGNLALKYVDNDEIQTIYAFGLLALCLKQELPELKETIEKLKHLAVEHVDNTTIQNIYSKVADNLVLTDFY